MPDYVDTIGRWGRGNIDLNHRIVVHNPDGSFSTELPFSVTFDGKEVLLPSIVNGVILSQENAVQHYLQSGEYLGKFDTLAECDEYAEALHIRQQWYYSGGGNVEKDILTDQAINFDDGKFHFVITNSSHSYDISKIVKEKGIKWTRNDIDSAKAGRNLKGTMNRGRVCTKIKLEVSCVNLTQPITTKVLQLINPEYVTVHYVDPLLGERVVQFYSNNVPTTFCSQASDGSLLWADLSFPLVER